MSKKTNTLFFVLGATVFNIIITIISFIVLMVLYTALIPHITDDPSSTAAWGIPVIFIGAIVISFLVYRLVLKLIMKKIDMEKYFDPIFGARRPARKD